MNVESNMDRYIGEIVGTLIREAAILRAQLEAAHKRIAELQATQPDGAAQMMDSR